MSKTKIICTLGPASGTGTVIRNMALAGMDVARLNFSHGTHAEQEARIRLVRSFNRKYRRAVKILVDLEGHRIRTGPLKDHAPVPLAPRQKLTLTTEPVIGSKDLVSIDYHGPVSDIRKGETIYIDDGMIALRVERVQGKKIAAEVTVGGLLKEHKGVNIPGAKLHFKRLSDKDRADILFGVEHGVDFIAQSFVRFREDIADVRAVIGGRLPHARIIAKIESREGIENLDEILDAVDGIMIARGDMGISLPIYEVPVIQKEIILQCKRRKKFVITATQMLESMVHNRIPTRAEVSDVANAVLDGTDFVMLSAETAVGDCPVETVRLMDRILKFTENFGRGQDPGRAAGTLKRSVKFH